MSQANWILGIEITKNENCYKESGIIFYTKSLNQQRKKSSEFFVAIMK